MRLRVICAGKFQPRYDKCVSDCLGNDRDAICFTKVSIPYRMRDDHRVLKIQREIRRAEDLAENKFECEAYANYQAVMR